MKHSSTQCLQETRDLRRKAVALSISKPSYTLASAPKRVRAENRERLYDLLFKLLMQHNWTDAGGVMAVLLKGTHKNRPLEENCLKYTMATELVRQVKGGEATNLKLMQQIYEIWMRKNGSRRSLQGEDKFAVQNKFIMLCLTEGNLREARQAVLGLMQDEAFRGDATANMVAGLTFYQLWYTTVPAELRLKEDPSPSSCDPVIEIETVPDSSSDAFSHQSTSSTGTSSVKNIGTTPLAGDDTSSSSNSKNTGGFYAASAAAKDEKMNTTDPDTELSALYACIFSGRRLEPWLLPLRLQPLSTEDPELFMALHRDMFNDYYHNALKHLASALSSSPHAPPPDALLPFIQLLVVRGRVREAIGELDRLCLVQRTWVLPARLKARILEHFHGDDPVVISAALEAVLERDPACVRSLSGLIRVREGGNCGTLSMLEAIARHLDAVADPETRVWRQLATCLLSLSQCEADRMSSAAGGPDDASPPPVPALFGGKEWRHRHSWWLKRHFPKTRGRERRDFSFMACRAACASHLYGSNFWYVLDALAALEQEPGHADYAPFLRTHVQHTVVVYPYGCLRP